MHDAEFRYRQPPPIEQLAADTPSADLALPSDAQPADRNRQAIKTTTMAV